MSDKGMFQQLCRTPWMGQCRVAFQTRPRLNEEPRNQYAEIEDSKAWGSCQVGLSDDLDTTRRLAAWDRMNSEV